MTHTKKKIDFLIDHIDPLGQGVYKKDDQIYFIPKTLPGDSGTAEIHKSKKNIHFARVSKLDSKAPNRIDNLCIHFESCNGCHYLHTDYESELGYKFSSFKRVLNKLTIEDSNLAMISAPQRLNYRNRIQLHYDKKQQKLGFIDPVEKEIISIPGCKIFRAEIQKSFDSLLSNWQAVIPKKEPNRGHVELYFYDDKTHINWNKKYSSNGFTQVYEKMNDELVELVTKSVKSSGNVLDLFGGSGNLSQKLDQNKIIVDYYTTDKLSNQLHVDLLAKNSLSSFLSKSSLKSFSTFIIDPPRKGFPDIKKWVVDLVPDEIIYVSCHPQTMVRDLIQISELYNIDQAVMLDLFPGTYHFEAMCVLKRKD